MPSALRGIGILIIFATAVGAIVSAVVIWKTTVSDIRWRVSHDLRAVEEEIHQEILKGQKDDVDAALERLEKLDAIEEKFEAYEDRELTEAYKKALMMYFAYACGMLGASLLPIGFGLFLMSMSEIVRRVRRFDAYGPESAKEGIPGDPPEARPDPGAFLRGSGSGKRHH